MAALRRLFSLLETRSIYALFGQLGFKFTDTLKLTVGVRQTWDQKGGTVRALAVEMGDRFNPNDPISFVTLDTLCPRARPTCTRALRQAFECDRRPLHLRRA